MDVFKFILILMSVFIHIKLILNGMDVLKFNCQKDVFKFFLFSYGCSQVYFITAWMFSSLFHYSMDVFKLNFSHIFGYL